MIVVSKKSTKKEPANKPDRWKHARIHISINATSPYSSPRFAINSRPKIKTSLDSDEIIFTLPDIQSHRRKDTAISGTPRLGPVHPCASKSPPTTLSRVNSPPHRYRQMQKMKDVKSRYLIKLKTNESLGANICKIIYYFYDCNLGNNGIIIKKLLSSRPWWKDKSIYKSFSPTVNFAWKISLAEVNFDRLVHHTDPSQQLCVNRLEHSFELSNKDNLFRNLCSTFGYNRSEILNFVPLTFSFRANDVAFEKDLQQFCRVFLSLKPSARLDRVKRLDKLGESEERGFPIYFRFRHQFPQGSSAESFSNFDIEEIKKHSTLFGPDHMWMLKPSGLNRGKGLELFNQLSELDSFLQTYSEGYRVTEYARLDYNDEDTGSPMLKAALVSNDSARGSPKLSPQKIVISSFVIQKYIEHPLLFRGHKFDIRVFVFLSHKQELFVFKDSYVRLSSLPYDPKKKNYLIHLTNNAVQVRSDSYGSLVKGNIISIGELEDYLVNETAYRQQLQSGSLMKRIREIVKTVFDSTSHLLLKKRRSHNFELFGLDFMIDQDLKVWLIEVNSVPSLSESNMYITRFMHRALDDMLKLTVDELFPPPAYAKDWGITSPYELPPFPNDKNLWESVAQY